MKSPQLLALPAIFGPQTRYNPRHPPSLSRISRARHIHAHDSTLEPTRRSWRQYLKIEQVGWVHAEHSDYAHADTCERRVVLEKRISTSAIAWECDAHDCMFREEARLGEGVNMRHYDACITTFLVGESTGVNALSCFARPRFYIDLGGFSLSSPLSRNGGDG